MWPRNLTPGLFRNEKRRRLDGNRWQCRCRRHCDLIFAVGSFFVAEFIGSVNMIEGRVLEQVDEWVYIAAQGFTRTLVMKHAQPLPDGTPVSIAIRPEKLDVLEQLPAPEQLSSTKQNWVRGVVTEMAYQGDVSVYHLRTETGVVLRVQETHWQRLAHPHYDLGDELYLVWECDGGSVLTS